MHMLVKKDQLLLYFASILTLGLISITGCSSSSGDNIGGQDSFLQGTVFGGTTPIKSSNVYIYDAGTVPGALPTQIGSAITDPQGKFSFASLTLPPVSGDLIYVVLNGGNAGGGLNSNIQLMSVFGVYGMPSFKKNIQINELTTVATASQLSDLVLQVPCTSIIGNTNNSSSACSAITGSTSDNWVNLTNKISQLVDVSTGAASNTIPAETLPLMNFEANVLVSCVNSSGANSGGTTSACDGLNNATTSASKTAGSIIGELSRINTNFVNPSSASVGFFENSGSISPNGKYLYAVDGDSYVYTFGIDSSGKLTAIGNPIMSGAANGSMPLAIAAHPNGKYVYVSNCAVGTVSIFNVSDKGTLTKNQNDVSTSANDMTGCANGSGGPTTAAITSNGKFLYVTNFNDGTLVAFRVSSSTGSLTSIGVPVTAGILQQPPYFLSPEWTTISPNGKNIYISNLNQGEISAFNIDQNTGVVSLQGTPIISGTGAASNPYAGVITPDGKNLFVSNYNEGTITNFSIDTQTGALTQTVQTAIAGLGSGIDAMTISRDGKYIYTGSDSGNGINALTVNKDGTLSLLANISTPNFAFGQALMSRNGRFLTLLDGSGGIHTYGLGTGATVDSLKAFLDILTTNSTQALFNLAPANSPFTPIITSEPTSLLLLPN